MKFVKGAGVLAAAFALVTVCASEAAAQQPSLDVTVIGTTVTVAWSPVAGASSYDVAVSGSINTTIQWPASSTRIVVAAPAGTYVVRVRGRAGAAEGPYSEPRTVTVGPTGPCGQIGGLTATTSSTGPSVQVNWTATPGALGYRVEFSRFAGSTELTRTVSADRTSFQQYIGMLGTFYVRVVAGNGCSTSTSNEVAFRIETLAGPGPRTPDPAPGTLIPRASLGYALSIVTQVAAQFRGDLFNSCREHGGNNVFMFRVVQALRQHDSRWGMNEKRGNQGLSQDIVTYNPTNRPDNGESQVYLFDTISAHCTGRPDVWFNDVTDGTWAAGQRGEPGCATAYCARWTIDEYLRAGFPADPKE